MINLKKIDIGIYITLFITCILILLQSPLAPYAKSCIGNDSSIFITIARNILDGDILYKDITDHKGPMIFIMDAIGLLLFKNNTIGIWFLEIISLWITSFFIYKTALLLYCKLISLASTILSLLFIVPILSGGNLTEEWCLPYIAVSLYIFVKKISNFSYNFTITELFILSSSFVIALMFKASYIGLWCAFGIIIIIKLLKDREWKKLSLYIFYILIFCLITFAPFYAYFHYYHAIKEANYWMFEYNMQYGSSTLKSSILSSLLILGGIRHLPIFVFLTVSFIIFNKDWKKNPYLFGGYILSIIATAYSCAIGNRYEHYNIIFVPLLVLPYGYLFNFLNPSSIKKKIAILILVMSSGYIYSMKLSDSRNYNTIFSNSNINNISIFIKNNSKPNETLMGDNFVDRAIYVYSDRKCINKYLCNSFLSDISNEIIKKKPTILIHNKKIESLNNEVFEMYELIGSYSPYEIYKIK